MRIWACKCVIIAICSLIGLEMCSGALADAPAHKPLVLPVRQAAVQPVKLHAQRLTEALNYLGHPLSTADNRALQAAINNTDDVQALAAIQGVLDAHCLAAVNISPESRVKVVEGPARRRLVQNGWRQFLVKVHNQAGVTAELQALSQQALPIAGTPANQISDRWLALQMYAGRPLSKTLSGTRLEYRIVQLYSRDAGQRSAVLAFNVGQGTQDIGFRNDVTLTFESASTAPLTLRVLDEHGKPTTAAFEFRDVQGRTYPSQAKRIEPDFAFHPQVYRADGESIRLPAGKYSILATRGPECLPLSRTIELDGTATTERFEFQRWFDPAQFGWWSGDHHIHAAGCAHYSKPSAGVHPAAMMRHVLGEDLKVGASLNWGPSFDYQKQFFTGREDKVSRYPYLLRYDVEVSGFGSHQSGHLCLLGLKTQIYPGGDSKHHWPTLCLNTLKWAQKQGAVCGPAHSGWGLKVDARELPTGEIPPFDSIGAVEYIVDVTHMVEGPDGKPVPAVDFMSLCDTPHTWELNIWYHTLNCGFRTRVSGETDFPCIYGERVGLGRSYVKVDGKLNYADWVQGISRGSAYVGDGRSHLIDFSVHGVEVGTRQSEVRLDRAGPVQVTAQVAAYLPETPDSRIVRSHRGPVSKWAAELKPYWHLERARIGKTRQVNLELIVNGRPVATKPITADGRSRNVSFEMPVERSSWVALRISPSSHTNPVFVLVDGQPIRASRRSAEWCLKSVDQCWSQKRRFIAEKEMQDAIEAYDHARDVYRKRIAESHKD